MLESISNAIQKHKIKRLYSQCKDDSESSCLTSTSNRSSPTQYLFFQGIILRDGVKNPKVLVRLNESGLEIYNEKSFDLIKTLYLRDIKCFSEKNSIWEIEHREDDGSNQFITYRFYSPKASNINQRVMKFLYELKKEEDNMKM
ncbi:hypothetical protein CYY_000939 [Polysphondylium violaceum]|uniref:Uncharacterized protein n=1 Tax=Polysphondylium violaceum TaxID=133409 RepID=A0A8J4Q2V1_9MYCE|nr:hypothetical protein CYY_000939 [Polysphondylium violaceum]